LYIQGSNDGISFKNLYVATGLSWANNETKRFRLQFSTEAYSYYRFAVTKTNGNAVTITGIKMYEVIEMPCIKYEPTYYMNVYNTNYMQPSLYSLEEKVIGCWINGKPLYEKTIEIIVPTTNASGSYVTNDTDISSLNIDLCTSLVGIVCPSDDNTTPLPLITNKNYIIKAIYVQNVIRVANSYKDYSGIKSYITIRYTKTTDTENSFTNSMLKESFIKLDSTCTDEELQQAILDIVDEINADPVVEPEQSIADIPMTIPEIYEEDEPDDEVIEEPETTPEEEITEPEEVTPEVTDEPETEQTEVTEGGTNNESE
jgi:hypothetical protein